MPTATSPDGAELAWQEYGAGPPLVLLTGQALDDRLWRPLLPTLALHHRVVLPAWRGTGESSASFPQPWTTRELAADVVTVLDAAGLESAAVWAFSLGGRAAQWLAADHPDRVSALVLSATTPGDRTGVPRAAQITSRLLHPQRRGIAELFFTPRFLARHPELGTAVLPQACHPRTLRAHYLASIDHDGAEALPNISAPTLVTHGGDDQICPPGNAELLASRISGARLYLSPTGRHGAHLESPSVARSVLRFIAAATDAAATGAPDSAQ